MKHKDASTHGHAEAPNDSSSISEDMDIHSQAVATVSLKEPSAPVSPGNKARL